MEDTWQVNELGTYRSCLYVDPRAAVKEGTKRRDGPRKDYQDNPGKKHFASGWARVLYLPLRPGAPNTILLQHVDYFSEPVV